MEEENVYSLSQSNFTKLSHEKEFGQERLIVESNNFSSLYQSGGIDSVVAALESDLGRGISGHDEDLRRRYDMFGSNHIVEVNSQQLEKRHFLQVILNATKDTTVILLLFCALLSFVLEIKSNGLEEGLIDGLMIFVVIFTASTFSQVVKFLQNRRNEKLVRTKKPTVTVKRDGRERQISISEVVVGDIVCLKTGDEVPGDGLIFHRSDGLKVDDYDDNDHVGDNDFHQVFSGSKVVGGQCSMLVTSVGLNTETRKMIKLLKGDLNEEYGGFQIEHDMMIFRLDKICLSLSLLVLVVQVLRCFIKKIGCRDCQHLDPKGVKDTAGEIMTKATNIIKRQGGRLNLFVEMIAVFIFAVRDGLPLGLLISFAYASKQFKRYRGIVQHLPACGTLGFVTTICTDITGDLFLEDAKMAGFWIGTDIIGESILNCVNTDVLDALGLRICMNSSSESVDDELLYWAKEVLGCDREVIKQNWTIEASEVQNNRTGLLLRWNGEDGNSYVNIHWKGAPDIILSMCTHYFDIDGTLQTLDEHKRDVFKKNIEYIRANSVQCIAFAWKNVEEHEEEIVELADDWLTLLAIVGLKNPYPPEVKQAIEACGELGVDIKLIVGSDTNTARLIAIISGILKPEEDTNEAAVVEASEFRNNYEAGGSIMANNIRALANASPLDKLLMVQCLKETPSVATGLLFLISL
ncbi:calcium-transporting ATPase 12, plasma membrane-type-like [Pistacia vera]|uniref:calcium-transporting ATPase 12, plasma membrane-type-like n=1 Tax=Pistacia vera TaxID=55513 RepID=UPI0012634057|nr:calcium-transporting ATPase 12, plasma membrane-type-like [Pistacia vera]